MNPPQEKMKWLLTRFSSGQQPLVLCGGPQRGQASKGCRSIKRHGLDMRVAHCARGEGLHQIAVGLVVVAVVNDVLCDMIVSSFVS